MNRGLRETGNVLELQINTRFPGFTLNANLTIQKPCITGIIGPSGCGKTTLLRCIAGLQEFSGSCRVLDRDLQTETFTLPVHQRSIGYVFQDPSLFPHLNVLGNIEYGRRRSRQSLKAQDFDTILTTLELGPLLLRSVGELSGGQKQRVALARALASQPDLLLLDEPFSALDENAKRPIMQYLKTLHRSLGTPMLLVSHSIQEHSQLVDQLIVMKNGGVEQSGPILDLLSDPSLSLNKEEDAGVVIEATVLEIDAHWHLLRAGFGQASLWLKHRNEQPGQKLRIRLLARDLSISLSPPDQHSILNTLDAQIIAITDSPHPAHKMVQLELEGIRCLARITAKSLNDLALKLNQKVYVHVKSAAVID